MIMSARLFDASALYGGVIAISRFRVIMYALAVGGAANVNSTKRTHSHANTLRQTHIQPIHSYVYMKYICIYIHSEASIKIHEVKHLKLTAYATLTNASQSLTS